MFSNICLDFQTNKKKIDIQKEHSNNNKKLQINQLTYTLGWIYMNDDDTLDCMFINIYYIIGTYEIKKK